MAALSPDKALIFRITHIANVPWILANGLHCRGSATKDPNFVEIGNPDLIDKRQHRVVPVPPGGSLSDYIPFYFTPYSPMLYNIKTGWRGIVMRPMSEIVIVVSSLPTLEKHGVSFLFSDRHANLVNANFFASRDDLVRLDWTIWSARDFRRDPNDPDKVARYQAEALAFRHVPVGALDGLVCHGPEQEASLREMVDNSAAGLAVHSRPGWYV
ncbi:MAG: DUF4433 domain-containing protein [Vicinamibacterales bacterium]